NTLIVGGTDDDSQNGAAWVFVRSLPPLGLSIYPQQAGAGDMVTATISGTGLLTGASVKLRRTGQTDIFGTAVEVAPGGMSLTASFDLANAGAGAWDVVVTNPFGQAATITDGFTVGPLEAPQLRIETLGPPLIRANTRMAFDLVIENPGNVDALAVPLWITGMPADATLELDFPLTPPPASGTDPDWSAAPLTFTSTGGRYLPILIPRVPPGTSVRRIFLTVPVSDPSFV